MGGARQSLELVARPVVLAVVAEFKGAGYPGAVCHECALFLEPLRWGRYVGGAGLFGAGHAPINHVV
jgi:hypothetical protein